MKLFIIQAQAGGATFGSWVCRAEDLEGAFATVLSESMWGSWGILRQDLELVREIELEGPAEALWGMIW